MNDLITVYEVAAFTTEKSGGSPTGVVLDAGNLNSDQMRCIARQLEYSHTAFVTELGQDNNEVGIRFFTSAGEIKNCAHATIAAHYVRATQLADKNNYVVKQRTIFGVQNVEVHHRDGAITVHFEQNEITFSDVDRETLAELLSILKLQELALQREYPVILASPGANRFMVAVDSAATLNGLSPDIAALKELSERVEGIGCFVFTVESLTPAVKATARMFAPVIGVDEDIINGNSSGCLGAYLLRLGIAAATGNELNLNVHQGQMFNRPGTVMVKATRIGNRIKTSIGGTAVIVADMPIKLES